MAASGAVEGRVTGRSNAVATSRASPRTLRQSGRFAVTSKSMTASPSGSVSSDATSNPRNPSVSAISCAEAGTSTNSRSQETTSRMRDHEEQMQPRSHEATKKKSAWVSSCFRVFVVAFVLIRKLFQKPQVVFVKEPNVLDPVPQDRHALDADPPRESRVALR